MLRDPHLAEDVTQSTFLLLARSAVQLTNHAVLAGWLHQTARNLASKVVRTEVRRREREQEVVAMNPTDTTSESDNWATVAPHLDDALVELSDTERDVVLLRYFQKKSAREIAATLKIGEEAAQRRVSRAVERLRELFMQKGVALGDVALVSLLVANGVQAAPSALTGSILGAVSASGLFKVAAGVGGAAEPFVLAAKAKTVIMALSVTVAVSGGLFFAKKASETEAKLYRVEVKHAEEVEKMEGRQDQMSFDLAVLKAENESLRAAAESSRRDIERAHGNRFIPQVRNGDGSGESSSVTAVTSPNPVPDEKIPEPMAQLGRQIGLAVVQGEAGAFEKLVKLSEEEHRGFNKASATATNDELQGKIARESFKGIAAAFDVINEAALRENSIALKAIERAVTEPFLRGMASGSLGKLASKGNEVALDILVDPEKHQLLHSGSVGALKEAANNGNARAIEYLAGITSDPKKRALFYMAADGLEASAVAGNQVALDALIKLSSETNQSVRDAAITGLQKAAHQQHPQAVQALQAAGLNPVDLRPR